MTTSIWQNWFDSLTTKEWIEILITTDGNLTRFLNDEYIKNGALPIEFLTPRVLERLFTDERQPDFVTAKFFGLTKKQVGKMREKHGIVMKSERFRLKMLQRTIESDPERAKTMLGSESRAMEIAYKIRKMNSIEDVKNDDFLAEFLKLTKNVVFR